MIIPREEEKDTVIVYHGGNCYDGFCAAWMLRKVFPNAEYVPAVYAGKPLSDVTDKNVVIADFCYPVEDMLRIARTARRMVVLDHHATAQKDLEAVAAQLKQEGRENWYFHFDMFHSGGFLTWQWLMDQESFPTIDPPWLVAYSEDRDLWRFELPHSREINAALRSYPLDFELWDTFEDQDPQGFAIEGAAILRSEQQMVATHVAAAREYTLAGYRIKACNATVLFSEIAGELAKDRPFGCCWFLRRDGLYQYSLRSRKGGVDVSQIAKQFGGGGHVEASGFEAKTLILEKVND